MSATTTAGPDVEAYLAAVRAELSDLRPDEREELLLDVEASIVDAARESDAPLAARLGPPAEFAAELRAAAGLARVTEAQRMRIGLSDVWNSPRATTARHALVELAPIWWVARAYAAVVALAWLAGDRGAAAPEAVRLVTRDLGLLLVGAAVLASVAIGLWHRRQRLVPTLALVVNVMLAAIALPVYAGLADWISNREYAAPTAVAAPAVSGLARDGIPVENIYPYSRDGRLLLDVLLFDERGAPLEIRAGDDDPNRRVLTRRDGGRIFNSFPIRHFDPETRRVARPGASPRIPWSPITTPRLQRDRSRRP